MIRLVFADIDNTLVPFGREHASERTIRAMHACLDADVLVGPATGRNRSEAATFLCNDEDCIATGVFCNGQQAYLDGRLEQEVTLDPTLLRQVQRIVCAHAHCALIVYRSNGHADWVGDDRNALGFLPDRAMLHGETRHTTLPNYPTLKAGIIACMDSAHEQLLRDELKQACPQFDFLNTVHQWFDIVPHGSSKPDGIGVVQQALGLSVNEVCVFGDAENDLTMFERFPHSCAVANATPEVQALAHWHVGASAEDGVAIALEQIAQAAREGTMPAFMR